MAFDSIPQRALRQAQARPEAAAYFVRDVGVWRPTSWRTYGAEIRRAARALIALGVEPGDTVGLVGFNRPEWTIMHVAAMAAGAVPVGIYTTSAPGEIRYILEHAGSSVVLLEDAAQWAKVSEVRGQLPGLRHVIMMRGAPQIADPIALDWEAFCARGDGIDERELERRLETITADQLATLIYTSGTTGPPKGVMLSHRNLAWTAEAAMRMTDVRPSDVLLSYLPLSHIAEQMFTIHGAATVGYAVHFAESIERVPDNLKEVQPHVFFGVPRIWEKFHAGISAKLREATGLKKTLAEWAMRIGRQASARRCAGDATRGWLAVQYRLASRLVFSKVKLAVGLGRARLCVSGAAPIAPDVLEFFTGLDLVVHEVYGQSEDCGPTSFNLPGQTDLRTVGRPISGVEVHIADDGEILVRGPNVFLGYYKDAEATAATLVDGWLCSGDLGELDARGFLRITGRKKEIIITAGGKNITPKNIEAALKQSPLISEAIVIGDRRKYLTALLTLDSDAAMALLATQSLNGTAAHAHPALLEAIQRHVDSVNRELARVESIKKFRVLPRSFTIEDGELTPTLKVKRKIVHEHFADQIAAMYDDEERESIAARA